MDKILENGTNVLLFRKINGKEVPNIFTYLRGTIIKSEQKEYDSMHGSKLVKQIYTIQCENGAIYDAVYGNAVNDYCIRTTEDYIEYIRNILLSNMNTINILNDYNDKLENLINSLSLENIKTK